MTNLFDSVSQLKGVGPKTQKALASLGINSLYDLVYYFPFRYDELQTLPLDQLEDGQKAVLKGEVVTEPLVSYFGYHKSRLTFKLKIDHAIVMVVFFNQPWLRKKIEAGQNIAVYGVFNKNRLSLNGQRIIAQADKDDAMSPVYSVNRQLKQARLVKLIKQALPEALPLLGETVPSELRDKFRLMPEKELVKQCHYPDSPRQGQLARRSAIFREFFIFEMQMALLVAGRAKRGGIAKKYDLSAIQELTSSLPFSLTTDQKHAVNEIFADLFQPRQMNRLLEGDVGSGKTIVAVYALFAAVTAGYQACLMAPTEILAQQHYQKINELLAPLGVNCVLLTGATKGKKKIYQDLTTGRINVAIGTQALIQDPVVFKKLGLVIVDEQHRFGVNQRQALLNKGSQVDFLAMTATPIPRTLALTVYGEMAVSALHQMPAGRKPIISKWVGSNQLAAVYEAIRKQIKQGGQVYAVTPLIEASEKMSLQNAQDQMDKLAAAFPEQKVVLLTGQMPADEKNQIMADFAAGRIDILVATSVIEVGVDVADASLMIIFDADHFGLSQLHQLRGRIGRGERQSYCYFVADPNTDSGKKRMKIIEKTTDGFVLAQEDLKLRGQGNLFGAEQSGLPTFQVGDILADFNTLQAAAKSARALVSEHPDLQGAEYAFLKDVLKYKQTNFSKQNG
jgi:ATP-dependent DNA helicase RecG